MRRAVAACALAVSTAIAFPIAGKPPPDAGAAATPSAPVFPCGQAACGSPAFAKPPTYSMQIARNGDFTADVTITQPCSCTRDLTLLLAFTPPATTATHERAFKLKVTPGTSTTTIAMTNAELAAAKVVPGRYAITFALYDERERPAGEALSGNPFSFGTSKGELPAQPVLPESIGRDADLAVPFAFTNDGDTPSRVTALLVFTRPGETRGIEYYVPGLLVPPGGTTHVVHFPPAKRREMGVDAGAWLVTASAFDGAGERMASYAGKVLTIGSVRISLPLPPSVTSPIARLQDLGVQLTVKNDGDTEDRITALLVFTRRDDPKPIEYQLNGIRATPGWSTHTVVLTTADRDALGITPGRWKVAASAFDRAGKRLETFRGSDLVIKEWRGVYAAP